MPKPRDPYINETQLAALDARFAVERDAVVILAAVAEGRADEQTIARWHQRYEAARNSDPFRRG